MGEGGRGERGGGVASPLNHASSSRTALTERKQEQNQQAKRQQPGVKAGAGRLELLESVFKGTSHEYIRRMYTHAHTTGRLKAYRRISGDPVDGVSIVTKAHFFL